MWYKSQMGRVCSVRAPGWLEFKPHHCKHLTDINQTAYQVELARVVGFEVNSDG